MQIKDKASFRDPCGQVFVGEDIVLRTVNKVYQKHWDHAVSSNLFDTLINQKLMLPFTIACNETLPSHIQAWKVLSTKKLPFISYAYEWSFPQLRDAALLTLKIEKIALEHHMTLKDASAYNIQFVDGKPIFIDILSFEKRNETDPWQAYRQFCMHFLAPLALQSFDHRLSRLSAQWIDGIPLDLAWSLLPARSSLSMGLQMHLHLHAKAEKKYADGRKAKQHKNKARLTTKQLLELLGSLERTIKSIKPPENVGDWVDYYTDTNYSHTAAKNKEEIVATFAEKFRGDLAIDFGANTGKYSAILANHFTTVIAADIDATAVAKHYLSLREQNSTSITPIVLDLANPSPAIGWACEERPSFVQRYQADFVCALALTHHLFFTAHIAFEEQAEFFASVLKNGASLIIEFVPRNDSQVERMLLARDDVFPHYTLENLINAFLKYFNKIEQYDIAETKRTCICFTKKD